MCISTSSTRSWSQHTSHRGFQMWFVAFRFLYENGLLCLVEKWPRVESDRCYDKSSGLICVWWITWHIYLQNSVVQDAFSCCYLFFFFFLSKSLEDVQVIHQPGGPYWVPEALNTAEGGNQDSGEPFSPKRTHLGRWITFLHFPKTMECLPKEPEWYRTVIKSRSFINWIRSDTCQIENALK